MLKPVVRRSVRRTNRHGQGRSQELRTSTADRRTPNNGAADFRTALAQLGILYIIALFVERSLEFLIKAWRQGGKSGLEHDATTAAVTENPAAPGRPACGGQPLEHRPV